MHVAALPTRARGAIATSEQNPGEPFGRGRPSDRVYARSYTLALLGVGVEDATRELLDVAEGDAHVIGQARDRCVQLVRSHPDSAPADRALVVITHAWLSAISATRDGHDACISG